MKDEGYYVLYLCLSYDKDQATRRGLKEDLSDIDKLKFLRHLLGHSLPIELHIFGNLYNYSFLANPYPAA